MPTYSDICLIFPPIHSSIRVVPLTLPWMASDFHDAGFTCQTFDVNLQLLRHFISAKGRDELGSYFADSAVKLQCSDSLDSVGRSLLARCTLVLSWEGWDSSPDVCDHPPSAKIVNTSFSSFDVIARFIKWAELGYLKNDEALDWHIKELMDFAVADSISPVGRYLDELICQFPLANIYSFSIMDEWQIPFAFRIAHRLKTTNSESQVVMGGAYFKALGEDAFNFNDIYDIVDCIWTGSAKSFSHRIAVKPFFGQPIVISNTETNPDLPSLSVIAHLIESAKQHYWSKELILPILLSRGCYWGRCSFCSEPGINNYCEVKANIVSDFLHQILSRTNPARLVFNDTILSPKRAALVAQCISILGKEVLWDFQSRFSADFQAPLLAELRRNGCLYVELGLESFDDNTRNKVRKNISSELISSNLRAFERSGLSVVLNLIYGFPWESSDIVEISLSNMEKIKTMFPNLMVKYNIQPFKPYKTSTLGQELRGAVNKWPLSTRLYFEKHDWIEQARFFDNAPAKLRSNNSREETEIDKRRLFKSHHSIESSDDYSRNVFYYAIVGNNIMDREIMEISKDLYTLLIEHDDAEKLAAEYPNTFNTLVEYNIIRKRGDIRL